MRVGIAAEHVAVGAAETYAFSVADGLARRGHSVVLLVLPEIEPEARRWVQASGVSVVALPHESIRRFRQARSCIVAFRPDVVHVNHPASPVLVAAWTRRVPVRVVTDHMLPITPSYNLKGSLLHTATRKAANLLVIVSRQNVHVAQRTWGALSPIVIYPGVPDPRCGDMREATRIRLGFDDDQFVVCTVGRLSREKRLDVLVRAMAEARATNRAVHGLLVGEGPARPELEDLVRSMGLQEAVTFTGHRNDVACLLLASDLYVHCSAREGMPFALLEAMASGLPAIVSDLPAHREAVGDVPVPVVPVGNYTALVARILELQRSREVAQSLATMLRERWQAVFTVDRMVRDHEEVYLRRSR